MAFAFGTWSLLAGVDKPGRQQISSLVKDRDGRW
jgi:hypothetical protein